MTKMKSLLFFHTPDFNFYDDEVVMSGASAIMDFTPGAGYLLWSAVLRGVPALGVCMTDVHKEVLYNHMVGLCLLGMADEGSDLHDPRFCVALGEHGETKGSGCQPAKAKAAPAKAKSAPKSKAKAKAEAEPQPEEEEELDQAESGEAASQGVSGGSESTPAEARLLAKLAALAGK